MLDYCEKNGILADIELIDIQDVNTAYERVLKSDVKYRFVIDVKSLMQDVECGISNGFGEFLFRLRVAPRKDAGWAMDGPPSKETKSSPKPQLEISWIPGEYAEDDGEEAWIPGEYAEDNERY